MKEVIKHFVVNGTWVDKATKVPTTGLVEVKQGQNKETGAPYQITDQNSRMNVEGTYNIGTIISFKMVMLEPSVQGVTAQQQNIKVGK
jgi:hypothetical protein